MGKTRITWARSIDLKSLQKLQLKILKAFNEVGVNRQNPAIRKLITLG